MCKPFDCSGTIDCRAALIYVPRRNENFEGIAEQLFHPYADAAVRACSSGLRPRPDFSWGAVTRLPARLRYRLRVRDLNPSLSSLQESWCYVSRSAAIRSARRLPSPRHMRAIDQLNARFGRGTIGFGTAGERQAWSLRRELLRHASQRTGTSCCALKAEPDSLQRPVRASHAVLRRLIEALSDRALRSNGLRIVPAARFRPARHQSIFGIESA